MAAALGELRVEPHESLKTLLRELSRAGGSEPLMPAMGDARERGCAIAGLWTTFYSRRRRAGRAFAMAGGSLRCCLTQALLSRCDLARRLLKGTPSVDRHCLALQILVDRKELLDLLA
jgi:hypothetical protein